MAWMLQLLKDSEQSKSADLQQEVESTASQTKTEDIENKLANEKKQLGKMSLFDLYRSKIETAVYDVKFRTTLPDSLMKKYVNAYDMDGDPELFDSLLKYCNRGEQQIVVGDIGIGLDYRRRDKLMSYTFSLNPAVRWLIETITSYREEEREIAKAEMSRFRRRSILHGPSPRSKKPHRFDLGEQGKVHPMKLSSEDDKPTPGEPQINFTVKDERRLYACSCSDSVYFDKAWTHVVVTVKKNTMKVYKNGKLCRQGIMKQAFEPGNIKRESHW